jgi:hypothetical protein
MSKILDSIMTRLENNEPLSSLELQAMGLDDERDDDEQKYMHVRPAHELWVDDFAVAQMTPEEVIYSQYCGVRHDR